MVDRLLLVEGEADRAFFEMLCRSNTILAGVRVAPPVEVGGRKNTKQGILNMLETLINDLNDGRLQALAIVVDADRISDGGGFSNTIKQITQKVASLGYDRSPQVLATGGLLYQHNDGLPDFGVWVMPDNAAEGMLEDWIKQTVSLTEQPLLIEAKNTVASLTAPKFKTVRLSKAEVATWLAWQEKPGEGLYYAIEGQLLDVAAPLYTGLVNWLKAVFPAQNS